MTKLAAIGNPRRVIKRTSETVTVTLTAEEQWDAAASGAQLFMDYEREEEIKKFNAKESAGKLKKLRAEISKRAKEATSGRAEREVDVETVYDLHEDTIYRMRVDTGEILGSPRKATDTERKGAEPDFGAS